MKTFRTMVMLQLPRTQVWTAVRDALPSLAPYLDNVESITVQERHAVDDSVVLVNVWRAKAQIPAALHSVVRPEMLAWTDRAEWKEATHVCHFRIEPHFAKERIRCEGTARYEEAMGGRGTRLQFDGTFEIGTEGWSPVPAMLRGTCASALESFVTTLIPRNFQKLGQAVTRHLQAAATVPVTEGGA